MWAQGLEGKWTSTKSENWRSDLLTAGLGVPSTIGLPDNLRGILSGISIKGRIGSMQIEALKVFCDVVRRASFSRGAEDNAISQSSASQAVHQLESRLGVKLIDRSKRPLVPTPQGKIFYEGCKDLINRYQELETRVKGIGETTQVAGTVVVASIYSVGLSHMTRFVNEFESLFPGSKVRLEYLHPSEVTESVVDESADLGLISFPGKSSELTVIPWRDEAMVLAAPPSHALAGRASVSFGDLERERFIAFDAKLPIRKAIDRKLKRKGVAVEIVFEFDNIENVKRAVESEAGISILPEPTLARERASGSIVAVPLADDAFTRPIAVIHKRGGGLSPAAARFLRLLIENGDKASAGSASAAERGLRELEPV